MLAHAMVTRLVSRYYWTSLITGGAVQQARILSTQHIHSNKQNRTERKTHKAAEETRLVVFECNTVDCACIVLCCVLLCVFVVVVFSVPLVFVCGGCWSNSLARSTRAKFAQNKQPKECSMKQTEKGQDGRKQGTQAHKLWYK